ncbi:VOC family protein [Gordonia sp. (in: high G+C Gram-positive bacteria)]|uniref:VOC family protein n=1 Tax=Gordonia sp. (in: high G+C Gram-positive bacteria) TaxID=84139 RepID=UPI0039E58813
MQINATAVSLNVADPVSSADFFRRHLGYREVMADDGFVSLEHPDRAGENIIFLRTGLPSFKPPHRAGDAGEGLLLAFVVDDVDSAYSAMQADGAELVTRPTTEPWGERYCQFADPNGIIVQLVEWVK